MGQRMNRSVWCAIALASVLLGGCATQTAEIMPVASPMPESLTQAPTPAGFIGFCTRFSSQCTEAPGRATSVALTDQSWKNLVRINHSVNSAIWPQDDEKHYGRGEYWTIPTDGYGDCDDYAVTKRKDLIDAGFPAPALRLAVVYSPQAGRHAVLTVKTDKGDLVLDNLRDDIVSWNATGFVWIERQAASNPMIWSSLQPVMMAQGVLPTAGTSANDRANAVASER